MGKPPEFFRDKYTISYSEQSKKLTIADGEKENALTIDFDYNTSPGTYKLYYIPRFTKSFEKGNLEVSIKQDKLLCKDGIHIIPWSSSNRDLPLLLVINTGRVTLVHAYSLDFDFEEVTYHLNSSGHYLIVPLEIQSDDQTVFRFVEQVVKVSKPPVKVKPYASKNEYIEQDIKLFPALILQDYNFTYFFEQPYHIVFSCLLVL